MNYWRGGYVQDLLIIISLIAVAAGLRRLLAPVQKLALPDALIAGALGILFGPALLGLLPFDPEHLELVIYHALALIFITVSLQSPPPGKPSKTARSIAFAIPAIAVLQAVVGLVCLLVWNSLAGEVVLHPGIGVLLPLGFSQGPGPAMTFGSSWEAEGLADGAQIGLIMAALGYAWCCVFGVGLVTWGRRRGWHLVRGRGEAEAEAAVSRAAASEAAGAAKRPLPREAKLGGLEPLTAQIVAVAIVYLATWVVLELVGSLLPEQHVKTLYGFHFLVATGLALALRPLAARLPGGNPLDDDLLARTSSLIVDVATCAALAAVSVRVLGANLVPILAVTSLAGLTTLLACLWIARRAFPSRPFEHGIITFGALTGTATTGLALLRMLDPQLAGPAARNYVLAVTPSAVLGLPLLLLIQMPVLGFPDTYPGKALTLVGILAGYVVVLVLAWRVLAPLRFGRRPWKIWAEPED